MASQQAASYAVFAEVPILRIWVSRWHQPKLTQLARREPWQIKGSGSPQTIDMELSLQIAAQRYGVRVDDIIQLEQLLAKQNMFDFIEHPLFMAMALRDY
jgi:hypothetical protein